MSEFKFISANADILGGKPIIKDTRISVELILEWLATGATVEKIVQQFPQLSTESVNEAILYASRAMRNEILIEAS